MSDQQPNPAADPVHTALQQQLAELESSMKATIQRLQDGLAQTKTAVDTAQQTASNAATKADAAQRTADTAVTKADAAQRTADTAVTKADAAQRTANTAVNKADNAQQRADTGVRRADEALRKLKMHFETDILGVTKTKTFTLGRRILGVWWTPQHESQHLAGYFMMGPNAPHEPSINGNKATVQVTHQPGGRATRILWCVLYEE